MGNHNTALFWEYDTGLGRRWNVDPIVKTWESPYVVVGSNPILYNDVLGNTLHIATKDATKNDIKSLVRTKNQEYLKIDGEKVSIDFGPLSQKAQRKILNKDGGYDLSMI